MLKVLFITTSHDTLSTTHRRTGVWLEELAAPYYIFKESGIDVTIASPAGGPVPLDPKSESIIVATPSTKRFLKDEEAMEFLSHSMLLEEMKAGNFDAVFLPGGHGCLWDLAENSILKELLETFNSQDKPIGAVAHGVAGLLSLQNDQGGLLIKDKQVTSTANTEEGSTGMTGILPFFIETTLLSLGALYTKGTDYVSYAITDGNITTGQNSSSSAEVARRIKVIMKEKEQEPVLQTDSNNII